MVTIKEGVSEMIILICNTIILTFFFKEEFYASYSSQYNDIEMVCQEAIEHDHEYGNRIKIKPRKELKNAKH